MRRTESRLKGVNRSSIPLVFMPMDVLNFGAIPEARVSARLATRGRARVSKRNTTFLDETAGPRSDCESRSGRADVRSHPIAGRGVGQLADGRLEIVDQVLRPTRSRDRAGDGRVSQDPLQEELGPAVAVELGGPRRHRL